MKIIKQLLFFAIIMLGCISCKSKAEKAVVNTETETVAANDSLHHAQGVVIDATMNGFTMVTPQNDTLYISTMDRNISLEGGLLLGDTLDVSYTVTDDEPGINMISSVKKVN